VEYEPGNSIALANSVRAKVPQAKDVSVLFKVHKVTVGIPQNDRAAVKLFAENENTALTDVHFFNLFDYQWEQGDKKTALAEPNAIVLSHSIAQKYFGSQEVMGKTLTIDSKNTFKVTGVVQDHPANTDNKTDIFLSLSSIKNVYCRCG
jgi:putative ABC transport system permease protein